MISAIDDTGDLVFKPNDMSFPKDFIFVQYQRVRLIWVLGGCYVLTVGKRFLNDFHVFENCIKKEKCIFRFKYCCLPDNVQPTDMFR